MRSRTSLFDKTILRKNLIRFAPCWGLYSLGLLMMLVSQIEVGQPANFAANMAYTLESMGAVNFFYALTVGLLLYGDLYNTRMCNALHALPLRRETWFATNLLSGLLFAVIPYVGITVLSLALAIQGWAVFLLWLAVAVLQYLFFFSVATLCAYITGQRFAMALIYGLVNFFSMIAYWLVKLLYIPLLYGVVPRDNFFYQLTPMLQMVRHNYLRVNTYNYELHGLRGSVAFTFREGWGYLAICVAVAVGLLALALRCYRKRDLEKAGDLVTIRGLGPVFLLVYTLCLGAFCHLIFNELFGYESYLFLILGFAIGFFTGQMLLKRTIRVFRWKTIGAFALFMAAFGLSFGLIWLDPLGISRYVPAAENVTNVSINTSGTYYNMEDGTVWNDIRQIEEIQNVHRYAVQNGKPAAGEQYVSTTLIYKLKNGKTVTREYRIPVDSEAGEIMRKYVSSPEYVLGWVYTGESMVTGIEFNDPYILVSDPAQIKTFLDAVIADSRAGNLPQEWAYLKDVEVEWITMATVTSEGLRYYRDIRFSDKAENLIKWMEENKIELAKWE